jgi:hypothetical protein
VDTVKLTEVTRFRGKPILVLGGGPTVNEALELVPADYPACVISANEHGFSQHKFHVDFIAYIDIRHGRLLRRMQDVLKPYGVPTISIYESADYQLDGKQFGRNAGFLAIQAAAELGGYPIIVAGVDCTIGQRPYFYQEQERAKDLRYGPGVKDRALRFAEQYKSHTFLRMPSATVWPWPEFNITCPPFLSYYGTSA